jgi:hypothetical protein
MKDFSNASFPPDTIGIMKIALDGAIATLPDPISSAHVKSIAEAILRTAKKVSVILRPCSEWLLLELQISARE